VVSRTVDASWRGANSGKNGGCSGGLDTAQGMFSHGGNRQTGVDTKLALIIDPSHITGAGASIGDKLGTGLKKIFGK
jgi:hypothetical protein